MVGVSDAVTSQFQDPSVLEAMLENIPGGPDVRGRYRCGEMEATFPCRRHSDHVAKGWELFAIVLDEELEARGRAVSVEQVRADHARAKKTEGRREAIQRKQAARG